MELPRRRAVPRLGPRAAALIRSVQPRAATLPGQLGGVVLVVLPALTAALPKTWPARGPVLVAAAGLGAVGAVAVLGGLLARATRTDPVPGPAVWRRSLAVGAVVALSGAAVLLGWSPQDAVAGAVLLGLSGLALAGTAWQLPGPPDEAPPPETSSLDSGEA